MQRPNLAPIFRWLTVVTAGLVVVQAFLAGRGLWLGETKLIDAHEMLANVLFLLAVAQFGLALAIGIPGALGKRLLAMNAVLAFALVAQTGLGYVGRDSMDARAWHFPLGVLIFGLAVMIVMMAWQIGAQATDNRQ